jgi:hypothetical protein
MLETVHSAEGNRSLGYILPLIDIDEEHIQSPVVEIQWLRHHHLVGHSTGFSE